MKEGNHLKKIPIIMLMTLGLILLFVLSMDFPFSPFGKGEKSAAVNDQIDSIEVDGSSVSTIIIPDNRSDVEAQLKGNGTVIVEKRGNQIEVQVKRKWFEGFRIFGKNELTVYIPEDFQKDLEIDLGSGNLEFDGDQMELEHLSVDVNSGNVKLKNLTVGSFEQDVSSGNVNLESVKADSGSFDISSGNVELKKYTGKLNGEVSSGRLHVEMDNLVDSIDLDVRSGFINLDLPKDGDFTLKGKMKSGSISNNHPLTIKDTDKNLFEGTSGSGKHPINLNVSSGKIQIN